VGEEFDGEGDLRGVDFELVDGDAAAEPCAPDGGDADGGDG
jgi:hypothetical protein